MDIRELFGVDVEKATNGTWIELGGGVAMLAKRADDNNTAYQLARSKVLSDPEIARKIQMGLMPTAELNAIDAKLLADNVIIDWRGVVLDGVEVPFSKEKLLEVLTMPCMAPFLEMVQTAVASRKNFKWEVSPEKK